MCVTALVLATSTIEFSSNPAIQLIGTVCCRYSTFKYVSTALFPTIQIVNNAISANESPINVGKCCIRLDMRNPKSFIFCLNEKIRNYFSLTTGSFALSYLLTSLPRFKYVAGVAKIGIYLFLLAFSCLCSFKMITAKLVYLTRFGFRSGEILLPVDSPGKYGICTRCWSGIRFGVGFCRNIGLVSGVENTINKWPVLVSETS